MNFQYKLTRILAALAGGRVDASDPMAQAPLSGAGIRLLVNEGLRLSRGDRGFWLCGVDDICRGRPSLSRLPNCAAIGSMSENAIYLAL